MTLPIWTSEDAARWRRLVEAAKATVANPSRPSGDLARLVDKAWKAVIPTRDGVGQAECWKFIQFVRTWCVLPADGQAENIEALGALAAKAEIWISPAAPHLENVTPMRAPRRRADIDDLDE